MCAGFIVPLLRFWATVWGFVVPAGAPSSDVAPHLVPFLIVCAAGVSTWWLPPAWYRTRAFEQDGRLYELIGVRLFRRLVPNGDWVNAWRRRQNPSFRVVSSYDTAIELLRRTIVGEKSHIVLFCLAGASAVYALRIGWYGWAVYLAAANGLANLYPILLQRYTRARIHRLAVRDRS
jgi:Glycosyl-4,4'-diaponeurosporenoate acyltransferase